MLKDQQGTTLSDQDEILWKQYIEDHGRRHKRMIDSFEAIVRTPLS